MTEARRDITPPLEPMLEQIRREYAQCGMPEPLIEAIRAFRVAHKGPVENLVVCMLGLAVNFLANAAKVEPDERVGQQVLLQTMMDSHAVIARAAKARLGEDLVPARMAIAAYAFAALATSSPDPVKPIEFAQAEALFDAMRTPIETERDALRDLVDTIADMDEASFEPEMILRVIVESCRDAQKAWSEE